MFFNTHKTVTLLDGPSLNAFELVSITTDYPDSSLERVPHKLDHNRMHYRASTLPKREYNPDFYEPSQP
jgi:hypothetical protein